MRKEIEELAKTITPKTKIEELVGKVESMEELNYLLDNMQDKSHMQSNDELSDELKLRALSELKNIPHAELTIPEIQRTMSLGFHNAVAVFDWLCGK